MSYEFTKLSDVPAVSEFPEGANAIIETNGEIKRCPPSKTPKPLTYDYMPEGYPSKSRFTIEWDGNKEGLTMADSMYKVSNLVVDPSVFASGATLTYADGFTEFMSIDAALPKQRITIEPGKITFGEGQVKIFTETPEPPFEIGVYFQSDEIYDVRKVTGGEVITPMAEEFLPTTAKNTTTVFYLS